MSTMPNKTENSTQTQSTKEALTAALTAAAADIITEAVTETGEAKDSRDANYFPPIPKVPSQKGDLTRFSGSQVFDLRDRLNFLILKTQNDNKAKAYSYKAAHFLVILSAVKMLSTYLGYDAHKAEALKAAEEAKAKAATVSHA